MVQVEQVSHIVTEDEMLTEGLQIGNFTEVQIDQCSVKTNKERFKSKFGASPAVLCNIYEDLQTSSATDNTKSPPKPMRLEGSSTIANFHPYSVLCCVVLCGMSYYVLYQPNEG